MERDSPVLLDIYTAANRILDFTAGINLDTFIKLVETHSAVLYQFIVIGEATGRLSEEFRAQHPVAPGVGWSACATSSLTATKWLI
jgi:uncharacterized protein with HEPN domain